MMEYCPLCLEFGVIEDKCILCNAEFGDKK